MSEVAAYLFLASGVAGRRVSVHLSASGDALACSDGQSILLPPAPEPLAERWPEVVAQAALIGAGSLQARHLRRLLGRPQAGLRYTYLEVLRACRELGHRLPPAFAALPELRCDIPVTASADESLAYALGRRPLPPHPRVVGTVRPLMTLRRVMRDDGWSALGDRERNGPGAVTPTVATPARDDDAEQQPLDNPFGFGRSLGELFQRLFGGSRGGTVQGTSGGDGGEMAVARVEHALRRGTHAVVAKQPIELPEINPASEAGLAYPEWDVHTGAFRQNWVLVEEVEAWNPDGARDVRHVLRPARRRLRRELAGLGLDHELHARQPDGADLDVGRLLDYAIDLRSGHPPAHENVYRASRRTRRDLAAAIVLDISGSTADRNAQGTSVFDRQMEVAWALGRTLHGLGDAVALYGFHSWGRKLVRMVWLKGFQERWSHLVAERFGQLEPVGYTRVGAAIRHVDRALRTAVRLPHRLLILISDGLAYDQDYESHYAEADARKALQQARANGTAVVCVCVGTPVQLKKLVAVFGSANILVAETPAHVAARIRPLCQQALTSVSRRRLRGRAPAAA